MYDRNFLSKPYVISHGYLPKKASKKTVKKAPKPTRKIKKVAASAPMVSSPEPTLMSVIPPSLFDSGAGIEGTV
jgi:hypothetical protein